MIRDILSKISNRINGAAIILMYHRICDLEIDPWGLSVNSDNFEQQLLVLKRKFNVISLPDLVVRLNQKKSLKNCVCITFDDGYLDNYLYAKPLLEKYNCPATFFIPTYFIGNNMQFWWDELAEIILQSPRLPLQISLNINDDLLRFDLENGLLTAQDELKHKSWRYTDSIPTKRCELYLLIWKRLQPLNLDEIIEVLNKIRKWANFIGHNSRVVMNMNELAILANNPIFKLGIHTATHLALGLHSYSIQSEEIATSATVLQQFSKGFTNIVAYPYGNYNQDTFAVMQNQCIAAAVTTRAICVTSDNRNFDLGRFAVENVDGRAFIKQLCDWQKYQQYKKQV